MVNEHNVTAIIIDFIDQNDYIPQDFLLSGLQYFYDAGFLSNAQYSNLKNYVLGHESGSF